MQKTSLILGDCLNEMEKIPDKSIDCVITDPPFGITPCKWDSVISFNEMWAHLKRITKKCSAIILFAAQPFSSALIMSNQKMFKYEWIWIKNNRTGHLNARCRPLLAHETICVFSEKQARATGDNMPYFPQGLVTINKQILEDRKDCGINRSYYRSSINGKKHMQQFSNYPCSVLYFSRDKSSFHPTQKPVSLLEYLILTYTKEGETVLDFAGGSFSTAIASINTNRNFIGIEKDCKFFAAGKNRVEKHIIETERCSSVVLC
jgi:site-specific DNA-methyltransferase (adenine-specific)